MGMWEVIYETASMHTHRHAHIHVDTCFHTHAHTCMCGPALRNLTGRRTWWQCMGRVWDSWGSSCLVSVGPPGRGNGVCLMCVCVWLLHSTAGTPGGRGGCRSCCSRPTGSEARSMAGCPLSPRGRAACLTVASCLCAVPKHLHGVAGCAVPGWARVAQGPGLWLLGTWVGGTQPACSCPAPSCQPPSPP